MRVRRGLLFWGLFLIPLGGITLLVRAGVVEADRLADAWRLWPLILIGIGLAIVLGRTRVSILGTAAVALVLGSIAGAALAGGNIWLGALSDCGGSRSASDAVLTRDGTFDPGASVQLDLRCGTLDLRTTSSPGWRLDATHRGPAPLVDSTATSLDVRVPGGVGERRNAWTIQVPATTVGSIGLAVNAGTATLDLSGAHLAAVDASMNAGDLRITAGTGVIDDLSLSMNAGRIRLDAGPTALAGDVSVNAGAFDLCVPDGVGLRLDVTDQLTFVHNLASRGLQHAGSSWTRAPGGGLPTLALSVDGSAASFNLNPEGGCR